MTNEEIIVAQANEIYTMKAKVEVAEKDLKLRTEWWLGEQEKRKELENELNEIKGTKIEE
jgi:hypothetical protein